MIPTRAIEKLASSDPLKLALGAAIVIGVVYFIARKTVQDVAGAVGEGAEAVASTAAGIATGNNVVTRGTVYENAGIFGTLGGAANRTIPILDDVGGWIGRTLFDLFGDDYDPNAPAPSASRKTNLRN